VLRMAAAMYVERVGYFPQYQRRPQQPILQERRLAGFQSAVGVQPKNSMSKQREAGPFAPRHAGRRRAKIPCRTLRRLLSLLILGSCAGEDSSLNRLEQENDSLQKLVGRLTTENDELKNGPDRLLAQIRTAVRDSSYGEAVAISSRFLKKHPESPFAAKVARIAEKADGAIKKEAAARERATQAAAAAERERLARALNNMRVDRDNIKNTVWYYDKSTPHYVNSRSNVHLYIGDDDSSPPWLRFRISYVADDWLFIEQYVIKADDHVFTIPVGHYGVERDNGSGDIWEWYDTNAGPEEIRIADAIANSKTAIIRYEGKQYRRDRAVSIAEKQAIKNVLAARDALLRAGK
jgi:hypothetical protein